METYEHRVRTHIDVDQHLVSKFRTVQKVLLQRRLITIFGNFVEKESLKIAKMFFLAQTSLENIIVLKIQDDWIHNQHGRSHVTTVPFMLRS